MRNHSGYIRGFIYTNDAWYYERLKTEKIFEFEHEFIIGFYSPEGLTSGEFNIKFNLLNGKLIPQLDAFYDSWSALYNFSDLLQELALLDTNKLDAPTIKDIFNVLHKCNIIDITTRTNPNIKS